MSHHRATVGDHRRIIEKRSDSTVPLGHVLSICLGLTLLGTGCGQDEPPLELPPRTIQWERVSDTPGDAERVISGIVTAVSDTKLAFEVQGVVATVDVNLGELVTMGQVLATLDQEPLEREAVRRLRSGRVPLLGEGLRCGEQPQCDRNGHTRPSHHSDPATTRTLSCITASSSSRSSSGIVREGVT